jgi:hypothetical protein
MKRCPKCSRTFPDQNQKFCTVDGGLLITDPVFDPNATIRATSAELGLEQPPQADNAATSRKLPDMSGTVAAASQAPTITFPRNTGPTGPPTAPDLVSTPGLSTLPGASARPAKTKSKLPLIIGGLVLLLLLGVGGAAAVFVYVIKPKIEAMGERGVVVQREEQPVANTNSSTNTAPENTNQATEQPEVAPFVPPADAVEFSNSKESLDGKLAEHYLDFSFYYPKTWDLDPKAGVSGANNFVKVERRLPPDFTQENFAVGWYQSNGSFASDQPTFPQLVKRFSESLSKNFPEYRKVSEGPTKVNSLEGYEFRFASFSKGTEKGDLQLWGRVIFLPTGVEGETAGATLSMLTTSLAPELSGVQDVGEKGGMPLILESFRFGKNNLSNK